MSHCAQCGQPVHPHQLTCGSCGASLREDRPPTTTPPSDPSFEKPDESEAFTLDDPLEPRPPARDDGPRGPTATRLPTDAPAPRRRRRRPRALPRGPQSSPAFVSRAWALVVDGMVLAVACSALPRLAWIGIRAAEAVSGTTELYDDLLTQQLTTIGQFVLVAAYFVFMHAGGQTIGKSLMGLYVVRLDGAPLDPVQSLGRFIGYGFSALPFGFGFLLAAFTPRRALHDYLAGTIVVRPRDMPNAPSEEDPA